MMHLATKTRSLACSLILAVLFQPQENQSPKFMIRPTVVTGTVGALFHWRMVRQGALLIESGSRMATWWKVGETVWWAFGRAEWQSSIHFSEYMSLATFKLQFSELCFAISQHFHSPGVRKVCIWAPPPPPQTKPSGTWVESVRYTIQRSGSDFIDKGAHVLHLYYRIPPSSQTFTVNHLNKVRI